MVLGHSPGSVNRESLGRSVAFTKPHKTLPANHKREKGGEDKWGVVVSVVAFSGG